MIRGFLAERPALGVGAFTLLWAIMEIIVPKTGVSPIEIVWARYGIHLLLMAVFLGRRQGFSFVRTRQPGREIFASLLMLGMPLFFVLAALRMPLQDTIAVFWTAPTMIIVFGVLFGHPLGGARTVALAVAGLVGAMLICHPDAGMLRPAAIFALGMSACFALYVVMMGNIRYDGISTKLFHTALWVFILLTLGLSRFWQMPSGRGIVELIVIAVLGLGGLYFLDAALEKTAPTVVAPVLYLQLAWDAGLHMARHWQKDGQLPDPATFVGAIIVLAAAAPILFHSRTAMPGPALSEQVTT
jgi:drug/metabolite transporter (DMT)-like permease